MTLEPAQTTYDVHDQWMVPMDIALDTAAQAPVETTPKILVASDLLSGEVVFMGEHGWTDDHRDARIARSDREAAALDSAGKHEMKLNRVVDAYLVEVRLEADGTPMPTHYREAMRTKGPSIRRDLGKQAA